MEFDEISVVVPWIEMAHDIGQVSVSARQPLVHAARDTAVYCSISGCVNTAVSLAA
jgi:hypothetical protein